MQQAWRSRGIKGFAAALSATLLAVISGTGASAVEALEEGSVSPENIKPAQKGSITIFKHVNQTETAVVGDPTNNTTDPIPSAPVAGVEFKAFPIDGMNLTGKGANENWKTLQTLDVSKACNSIKADGSGTPTLDSYGFGTPVVFDPTGADGKTSKDPLAQGAYVICETKAPADVVTKAAPILITIPYPDTQREGKTNDWIYDVTLFPKNDRTKINKTIEEQKKHGYGIGSEVHYPVDTVVPTLPEGNHFDYFIIEDPMDSRFAADSLKVVSVKIGETVLEKDTDYEVTVDGQKIQMGLTAAGLAKAEAAQGQKLEVIFAGKIVSVGDGTVPNKANLWVKSSPQDTPPSTPPTTPPPNVPPIPSVEVKDYWGDLKLLKYDGGKGNTAVLEGAVFEVYEAATPYPEDGGECTAEVAQGAKAIEIDGETQFTSDANGVVNIGGLFISDSIRDPQDRQDRCYVVKEVTAPDGYLIKGEGFTPVKVKVGETEEGTYDVQIANEKPVIPGLPLTGSNAQVLLQIVGVLLVVGGVLVYAVRRYREQNA